MSSLFSFRFSFCRARQQEPLPGGHAESSRFATGSDISTTPLLLAWAGGGPLGALPRTPRAPVFAPVAEGPFLRHEDIVYFILQ